MQFALSLKYRHLGRITVVCFTLWVIFVMMPFVDALTGYMINKNLLTIGSVGSPSQLFRFLLTLLLILQIRKPIYIYMSVIMIAWILAVECMNLSFHNRLDWLVVGAVYSYKLSFGLIVYFVFAEYFDKKILNYDSLQNYIVITCIIYTSIVIISDIMGISANSYVGMELGSKGIFADGNGMGVFLGVCSLVVLNRYVEEKKVKDLIIFFLTGKVLVGLMSKAGILFFLVGLFLLFCKQPVKLKVSILFMVGLVIYLFIEPITFIITESLQLILWRIERSDTWWQIILGGREIYLYEVNTYSYGNFIQIIKLIFGGGYRLSFRDPLAVNYDPEGIFIVEADIFDVYFMYGIIGFIVYIAIFFKGLHTPKVKGKNILKWAWVLLFIHSALAGHVLSSGIALLILPCLLLLMENRKPICQTTQGI